LTVFALMVIIAFMPSIAFVPSVAAVGEWNNPIYPVPSWKTTGSSPFPWNSRAGPQNYNNSGTGYNPTSPAVLTSHLLWINEVMVGGSLISNNQPSMGLGGEVHSRYEGEAKAIIFGGRVIQWRSSDAAFVCYDEWTGQKIWTTVMPPSPSGVLFAYAAFGMKGNDRFVGISGNNIVEVSIDAGTILATYTLPYPVITIQNQTLSSGNAGWTCLLQDTGAWTGEVIAGRANYAYLYTYPTSTALSGTKIWGPVRCGTIMCVYDEIFETANPRGQPYNGYDLVTGNLLWTNGFVAGLSTMRTAGYGMFFQGGDDGAMYAVNAKTGALVWRNRDLYASYWTENGAFCGNGTVIDGGSDWRLYCFDAFTGELKWTFSPGPCPYEPYKSWYGGWPFCTKARGSGGVVYQATGAHSVSPWPNEMAGEKLYALNISTGELLWSFPACMHQHVSEGAVADGIAFYDEDYTNRLYAFGKGPTAVEISVTQSQIVKGGYTWITGRVTDQSPAQPGTPCVSKASMDAWMAYLHADMPAPAFGTVTGVPVTLQAVASDGNVLQLGQVTTDSQGYFKVKWTPPDKEELYTVTATFDGDESYYTSWAGTDLAVDPVAGSLTSATVTAVPGFVNMTTIAFAAIIATTSIVSLAALIKLRKYKGGIEK